MVNIVPKISEDKPVPSTRSRQVALTLATFAAFVAEGCKETAPEAVERRTEPSVPAVAMPDDQIAANVDPSRKTDPVDAMTEPAIAEIVDIGMLEAMIKGKTPDMLLQFKSVHSPRVADGINRGRRIINEGISKDTGIPIEDLQFKVEPFDPDIHGVDVWAEYRTDKPIGDKLAKLLVEQYIGETGKERYNPAEFSPARDSTVVASEKKNFEIAEIHIPHKDPNGPSTKVPRSIALYDIDGHTYVLKVELMQMGKSNPWTPIEGRIDDFECHATTEDPEDPSVRYIRVRTVTKND